MMISGRIFCAVVIAAVLSVLPLPEYLGVIRPAWILLLVLYIQSYLPKYFHVLAVLCLGLCLDALLVTPMGEHAFALIITTWLMVGSMQRFLFYSIFQQMLIVGLACWCYQFILYIAEASFGYSCSLFDVSGVALTSMLCWPMLCQLKILHGSQHRHASTLIERFSK